MTKRNKSLLFNRIITLTEISETSIDKLFEIANPKQFEKGINLLKEGQICKKIFFVEKGLLRTFYNKDDGNEINTNFTFEGNFATNLKSLSSSTLSDTSIKTSEPTFIYEFDKDQLLELYKHSPEIESFGRKLLEQLLIEQEEHSNLFKLYSPKERYQYLQQNKPELLQRISLSQIASYLGIARETLSRIRKG